MNNAVIAWVVTAFSAMMAVLKEKSGVVGTAPDPLYAYIVSQNYAIPPMPRTGGQIHKISTAMAKTIADLIRQYATPVLPSWLIAGWLKQESRYDPDAIDPNNQDDLPGQTAEQKLQHADVSIAQMDMTTLESIPDFKGMAPNQIIAKIDQPVWGVQEFAKFATNLLLAAKASCEKDPTLLDYVPNRDYRYLGIEGYNVGPTGALREARNPNAKWAYATAVLKSADEVQKLVS